MDLNVYLINGSENYILNSCRNITCIRLGKMYKAMHRNDAAVRESWILIFHCSVRLIASVMSCMKHDTEYVCVFTFIMSLEIHKNCISCESWVPVSCFMLWRNPRVFLCSMQMTDNLSLLWQNTVDKLIKKTNLALLVGTNSWRDQFIEAITVSAGKTNGEIQKSCVQLWF